MSSFIVIKLYILFLNTQTDIGSVYYRPSIMEHIIMVSVSIKTLYIGRGQTYKYYCSPLLVIATTICLILYAGGMFRGNILSRSDIDVVNFNKTPINQYKREGSEGDGGG